MIKTSDKKKTLMFNEWKVFNRIPEVANHFKLGDLDQLPVKVEKDLADVE